VACVPCAHATAGWRTVRILIDQKEVRAGKKISAMFEADCYANVDMHACGDNYASFRICFGLQRVGYVFA
jgi:hypothetical protein